MRVRAPGAVEAVFRMDGGGGDLPKCTNSELSKAKTFTHIPKRPSVSSHRFEAGKYQEIDE